MKHRVTVYTWVLAITMITLYVCGMVVGYSLGIHTRTQADSCSYSYTPWTSTTTCDGRTCTSYNLGGRFGFGIGGTQCDDSWTQQPYPSEVLG